MNETGKRVMDHIHRNHDFRLYFGSCAPVRYGTDLYSQGIRMLCASSLDFQRETSECARRFYAGDYGEMYDWDERPIPGHEKGWYPTDWGDVYVERGYDGLTTMCMSYER